MVLSSRIRAFAIFCVFCLIISHLLIVSGSKVSQTANPERGPEVIFEMEDPAGDDYGPGTYTYPTHKAFAHPGLFDLLKFVVSYDIQNIYFDFTFKEIVNPWNAPEGFSHQLVDLYIDNIPGEGLALPLRPGPNVAFSRRNAWDYRIKIIGWGGTRLYSSKDEKDSDGIRSGLRVHLLPDKKTIRAVVPITLLGKPDRMWRYYVLVGSQDAFGNDDYRPVMEQADSWFFGGGRDSDADPNVIDLLAVADGPRSQEKMLRSYNPKTGAFATIYPVGPGAMGGFPPLLLPAILAALLVIGVLLLVTIRWARRK